MYAICSWWWWWCWVRLRLPTKYIYSSSRLFQLANATWLHGTQSFFSQSVKYTANQHVKQASPVALKPAPQCESFLFGTNVTHKHIQTRTHIRTLSIIRHVGIYTKNLRRKYFFFPSSLVIHFENFCFNV